MNMNNKGFTLIEVLGVLIIISTIMVGIAYGIQETLSASKEEAYKVMKNNIISVSYDYVQECSQGIVQCNFSYEENNYFYAKELQNSGYFQDLNSPIDGKELGNCMLLKVTKNNGVVLVDLVDECY